MTLNPLEKDDPKLRQVCEEISLKELRTVKTQKLIDQMLDFVYGKNNKGENRDNNRPMTVGLSANQIGIMKRICIVDLAIGHKKFNDIHVLINPKVIWRSKSEFEHREGCVNLNNICGVIKRHKEVKVEALDRSGNIITVHARGWASVLLQHEIDHINGYLFIDYLEDPTKAHLVIDEKTAEYRKNFRIWDKFIDVSNLVRSKSIFQEIIDLGKKSKAKGPKDLSSNIDKYLYGGT